jgi:homoserine dehydrogenase
VQQEVIVLKFGSSVLRTRSDLPNAVHEIYRWYRTGLSVVAVVSAIGETTDQLIAQARELAATPEPYALAELLATGERASAALLGVTLDRSGIPARVLNPREIGLTVAGSALDSEPFATDLPRFRSLLSEHPVLIVPGFFGTDVEGRTHLLGRGGSDLSAVFLAHLLNARCRLIKDVDGVYESDPALTHGSRPRRFASLSYGDALQVAAPLIQPKAVSFLRQHGRRAEVAALTAAYESTVGAGPTELAPSERNGPSKVLLLGLGTVGFGVYERWAWNPDHFRIVGALVRAREKHASKVPGELLHTSVDSVYALRPDIVVDGLSGTDPSRQLIEHFLRLGTQVVSANKALIAEAGAALSLLAKRSGATLRYSAAVGGATPMLEAVHRAAQRGPLSSIAAVLNGTCNFVLDRCAEGSRLDEAIAESQRAGFAEADPSEDLSAKDSERKLRILSRHAFDAEPEVVEVQVLDERIARYAHEVTGQGMRLRQVARAFRESNKICAAVTFEPFGVISPFGSLSREWNAIEIREAGERVQILSGRGAGRWPTAEAVMADLYDAHRERSGRMR